MAKGHYYNLGASVSPKLVAALDELRGTIPRSRLVEIALRRFIADLQDRKISIIENERVGVTGTFGVPDHRAPDSTTNHSTGTRTHPPAREESPVTGDNPAVDR